MKKRRHSLYEEERRAECIGTCSDMSLKSCLPILDYPYLGNYVLELKALAVCMKAKRSF